MEELANNIFMTSLLVVVLLIGYMKFRTSITDDCVSKYETYIVVTLLLFSFAVCVAFALILIWI